MRVSSCSMCVFILLGAVCAATAQVPPINSPPSDLRLPGKLIWADLVTRDAAAASSFYQELFGWQIESVHERYNVARHGGRPIAGIAEHEAPERDGSRTQWLPFVSVGDPAEAAAFARAHGGRVLAEPRTVKGRGRHAILADPEGALLGVLRSASGDPPDRSPTAGQWLWMELWASDPAKVSEFYALAGYEFLDNWYTEDAPQDLVLASAGVARASIVRKLDAGQKSGWLLYVRVEDVEAATRKAQRLGGRVLLSPSDARSGFPLAILSDPTGAVFAVVAWSPTSEEVP